MSLGASSARLIARYGETMVLKRASEVSTITLKGKRTSLRAASEELSGGSAAQQFFHVLIGTTELTASSWANKEPARKDSIVVDGRERRILDVRPLKDGDTTALYNLEVVG